MRSLVIATFLWVGFVHSEDPRVASALSAASAHALLSDVDAALGAVEDGLHRVPDDPALLALAVELYGKQGALSAMMQTYRQYQRATGEQLDRPLVEKMAWTVLDSGERSPMPTGRLSALLGAYLGNDSRGVDIVLEALDDSNAYVRGVAIEVAGVYPDKRMQEALVRRWKVETTWAVKMQLIRAFGRLRIEAMRPMLMELVSDASSRLEDRAVAIEAIVNMTEEASREQIEVLATSTRAGLRMLACRAVAHLELARDRDIIVTLMNDPHDAVRVAAIQAWGIVYDAQVDSVVAEALVTMMESERIEVSLAAAWAGTVAGIEGSRQVFHRWLASDIDAEAIAASMALASAGPNGYSTLSEAFHSAKNRFVRVNLAIGLIGLRRDGDVDLSDAAAAVAEILQEKRRVTWSEGLGRGVVPFDGDSGSFYSGPLFGAGDAETVDQMARLELLSLLAIVDSERSQEALEQLLHRRRWGMSGIAASLLLQEGNSEAVAVIKEVMESAERAAVRIQAALVLALWGRNPAAIESLEAAYPTADRQLKEHIIEGVGRIGDTSSIPFLIERLEEPSETLRLLAAASLIQALNH